MARIKNKLEAKEENLDYKLIKEQIKRISIFGTFEEQDLGFAETYKKLGKKLVELGLTIVVGGDSGAIKDVSLGVVENKGKVIVVKSKIGKKAGYVTKNIPGHLRGVYCNGELMGKNVILFNKSGAYFILPESKNGLGTRSEMLLAIAKIDSFDNYVGSLPKPVIFVGSFWKKMFNDGIKPRLNQKTLEHVYFIQNTDEIEPILLKYAKIKNGTLIYRKKEREYTFPINSKCQLSRVAFQ